jgi:hypothetical protein
LIRKANDTNFVKNQGAGDQYKLRAIWGFPIPKISTIATYWSGVLTPGRIGLNTNNTE